MTEAEFEAAFDDLHPHCEMCGKLTCHNPNDACGHRDGVEVAGLNFCEGACADTARQGESELANIRLVLA